MRVVDESVRDVAVTLIGGYIRSDRFWPELRDVLRPARALVHPNIVELVDVCATPEAEHFVVTEYIKGCPLRAVMRRRDRIPPPAGLYIMIECCKGLAHAHPEVIHRHVNPDTVVVSTTGEVKLTDFGFAKIKAMSETESVSAKFSYLSPEAASGLDVDHRADVFAAGIVLWELLAGERLFVGATDYQTVELVRAAPFRPIDGADPTLLAILRCALSRDPDARFATAAHFGEALAQFARTRDLDLSPVAIARLANDVTLQLDREHIPYPGSFDRMQADVDRMRSIFDATGGSSARPLD